MLNRRNTTIILFLLLCGWSVAQSPHVYQILTDQCQHGRGALTGFRVKGIKGIVTSLHGIATCARITARNENTLETFADLKLDRVDIRHDLAVLTSEALNSLPDEGLEPLDGESSYQQLAVIGYPYELGGQTKLELYSVDPPLALLSDSVDPTAVNKLQVRNSPNVDINILRVTGTFLPGDSGAPVIDHDGHILGVALGGLEGGIANFGWAIPWSPDEFDFRLYNDVKAEIDGLPSPTATFSLFSFRNVEQIRVEFTIGKEKLLVGTFEKIASHADYSLGESTLDPAAIWSITISQSNGRTIAMGRLNEVLSPIDVDGRFSQIRFRVIKEIVFILQVREEGEAFVDETVVDEAVEVTVEPSLLNTFEPGSNVKVNSIDLKIIEVDTNTNKVRFLSNDPSVIRKGLNWIGDLLFWQDDLGLKQFEVPYKNSYAILVAIDKYPESSGVEQLGKMVENAKQLKQVLIELGFPDDNIIELYDDGSDPEAEGAATSDSIEGVLESFWKNEEHGDADRLVFYFGGHGRSDDNKGYLVTYDYNPAKPSTTSLLMKDLRERQSDEIQAHHVAFFIDACSSGLVVGDLTEEDEPPTIQTLRTIKTYTEEKARNFLVAGTDDARVLYDGGGLFTQSLIRALEGEGDIINDGIIQFYELAIQVKNDVAYRASNEYDIKQKPNFKSLDNFGDGEMLFILPPQTDQ